MAIDPEDQKFREYAYRTVAAELNDMIRPRPELASRYPDEGDARWVRAFITYAVENLKDRLAVLADDEGIDLQVSA